MSTTDYSKWCTQEDILIRLGSAGIRVRNEQRIDQIIDEVIDEVASRTRRQFIAGADGEIRTFDGSGTVEQEVDEFITLDSVVILGWLGLNGFIPVQNPVVIQEQGLPQTRILIYQGTSPIYQGVYIDRFPPGYSNIQVQAQWGYGATIPRDLWNGVAGEITARIAREAQHEQLGILVEKRQGDTMKKWDNSGVEKLWTPDYRTCVKRYTRRNGRRFRNLRAPMI